MNLKKFFSELKRREVYKVAIAYGITAWLIAQISGLVSASFEFPSWVMQMIITILIIGFPIVLVLSWVFEVSSKGIVKTTPLVSDDSDKNKSMEIRLVIGILVLISILMVGGWWTWQKFGFDKRPPIRSLVVLPFDNFTGSDEYEYFVAGIHSSLIQDISKIGKLKVKSKTTANSYKETDMSVPEIASELGIDAAVEGSITCMGEDSVCVQIRLISAYNEEQQIWVQDYEVAKDQILNFYNDVTKKISQEINVVLTPQEENLLAEVKPVDPGAYDAYLKGRYYWDDLSLESLNKAREYLENAVEIAPDWAAPYAGLAQVWVGLAQMGLESPEIAGPKIMENLEKAIELDPNFPDSHYINGIIAVWTEWNWEKGEKEFLHALAINPSDAMSRIFYAHLLISLQRQDEAMSQAQRAVELDPMNPLLLGLYAVVAINGGAWEDARTHINKSLSLDPDGFFTNNILKFLAFHDKDIEKILQTLRICWQMEESILQKINIISEKEGFDVAYAEAIQQVGLMNGSPIDIAVGYMITNQPEKALESLETGFKMHDSNIPYITTHLFNFEPLYGNPRFIDIVEKMNLPLDANQ